MYLCLRCCNFESESLIKVFFFVIKDDKKSMFIDILFQLWTLLLMFSTFLSSFSTFFRWLLVLPSSPTLGFLEGGPSPIESEFDIFGVFFSLPASRGLAGFDLKGSLKGIGWLWYPSLNKKKGPTFRGRSNSLTPLFFLLLLLHSHHTTHEKTSLFHKIFRSKYCVSGSEISDSEV